VGCSSRVATRECDRAPMRLELLDHLVCEKLKHLELRIRDHAWHAVDRAERSDNEAIRCAERDAGIEPDQRCAEYEWVVGKPLVSMSIRNHERLIECDHVTAERDVARGRGCVEPVPRLEPLAVAIHQRDERDRHPHDVRSQAREVIERRLRSRVEDLILIQRCEPSAFVGWSWGKLQGDSGCLRVNGCRANAGLDC
jgi:hypothetical protein